MTVADMTVLELKKREKAVRQEFPQMEAAFSKVREALVDKLVGSGMHKVEERERLYFAIQTLDAVKEAMTEMIGIGSDDIDKYLEQIAKVNG